MPGKVGAVRVALSGCMVSLGVTARAGAAASTGHISAEASARAVQKPMELVQVWEEASERGLKTLNAVIKRLALSKGLRPSLVDWLE